MGNVFKKKVLSACLAATLIISTCFVGHSVNANDQSMVRASNLEGIKNESSCMNIAREALVHVYCAERDLEMEGDGYTLDSLTDGDSRVKAPFYASRGYEAAENTVSITMEFSGVYDIENITLTPAYTEDGTIKGFPEEFTISVKTSRGWRNVVQETGYEPTLDKQVFQFPNVKGTAVRLTATKLTADGSWYTLYMREMEVWGYTASEFDLTTENLAYTQKPVIESPQADPWGEEYEEIQGVKPYCKESLLDGAVNTYYISTEVDSADSTVDITMTFDDFYEVDNVTFWPRYVSDASLFFPEDFTISVKTRNGGWQTVVNANGYVASKGIVANEDSTFGFDDGKQSFDFDAIVTNTIKFTATKLTCNTEGVYALYLPEMEVYGQSTEYTTYNDNIALSATVSADLADESMFEYGFTPDKLIDDTYDNDSQSYISMANSRAEDFIEIVLDFDGWYTVNNVSLKPHIQENILHYFPEDFEISVRTETGWESVLKRSGYTVAVPELQSFDFEEVSADALKLSVTRLTKDPNGADTYALYLTELQIYGETTDAPILESYSNVALADNAVITTDSHNEFMGSHGFTIDKLIDGKYETYDDLGYYSAEVWSETEPVEIILTLDQYYAIHQINLFSFDGETSLFPIDFEFAARTADGWIPVKTVTGYSAESGENAFLFDTITCDGVKLTITKLPLGDPVGTYFIALAEMQVWGTEAEPVSSELPDDITNIAIGQHCVAGAVKGTDLASDYINDGDIDTLYTGTAYSSADVESGEYILLNLSKPQAIHQVKIHTNYQDGQTFGFPKTFKIRSYCDGEWIDMIEKSDFEATGEVMTFSFPQTKAERVELIATVLTETDTEGTYALQVEEVEVYGKATATASTADLNLDYEVNEADLDIMRGNLLKTQYSVLKSADCNSDDSVDVRDLVSLKKQYAQNVPTQNTARGTTYYVDSSVLFGGDGLSQETPLRTLDAVNALRLHPGDCVLFKRGSVWTGQLRVSTSGTNDAPIIYGSYGSGALPLIQGAGQYDATIYGENVSYVTVQELEITNSGDSADYHRGIYFCAKSRSSQGISITDCYVHSVESCIEEIVGGDIHWLGGIVIKARSEDFPMDVSVLEYVVVSDVLIQNNTVENCIRTGIVAGASTISEAHGKKCTDMRVLGNEVLNCYGDGIILFNDHAGIIEGNLSSANAQGSVNDKNYAYVGIWNVESSGTLMQYNESCDTQSNRDGQGFDIDGGCSGTLFQYNYSHDNAGGALLLMQNRSGSATIRHNISQNDSKYVINFSIDVQEAPLLRADIYNNIIYTQNAEYMMAFMTSAQFASGYDAGDVYNNVFYAYDGAYVTDGSVKKYMNFSGNLYYNFNFGFMDEVKRYDKLYYMDDTKKTSNPKFANVGTGEDGLLTLGGYVLQNDSPCKDMGFQLPIE